MDINMPEMGGIEAAGIIKERYPNVSIVFQTANTNDEVKKEALEAGGDYLVHKPISEKEILPMLKKCIS